MMLKSFQVVLNVCKVVLCVCCISVGTVLCLQYRNDWCWLSESSTCNAKPRPELPSADSEGHPWHCRVSHGGWRHHLAELGGSQGVLIN